MDAVTQFELVATCERLSEAAAAIAALYLYDIAPNPVAGGVLTTPVTDTALAYCDTRILKSLPRRRQRVLVKIIGE